MADRVLEGKHCSLWMTEKVAEQFHAADAKQRRRCIGIMERFVEHGSHGLGDDKLRKEGTFSAGRGERCAIFAFKAGQLRVYGGYLPGRRKEFVCTELDVKKRNRADQERLKRSAKLLGELARQIEGNDE